MFASFVQHNVPLSNPVSRSLLLAFLVLSVFVQPEIEKGRYTL